MARKDNNGTVTKAEPRQLPLYACTTSNFKKFVYNDNNL